MHITLRLALGTLLLAACAQSPVMPPDGKPSRIDATLPVPAAAESLAAPDTDCSTLQASARTGCERSKSGGAYSIRAMSPNAVIAWYTRVLPAAGWKVSREHTQELARITASSIAADHGDLVACRGSTWRPISAVASGEATTIDIGAPLPIQDAC